MKITNSAAATVLGSTSVVFALDHGSSSSSSRDSSGSYFVSSGCLSIDDLCETNDYSSFCSLLKKHDFYDRVSTGTWTMFVPTNQAFDRVSNGLASLDDHSLSKVLKSHLVEGDLVSTLNSVYESGDYISVGRTDPENLHSSESLCGGGVYYILNEVILPPSIFSDMSQFVQSKEDKSVTSTDNLPTSCYVSPMCNDIPTKGYVDPGSGFTNSTGFDTVQTDQCCNICADGGVTNIGPYDYLLLDLMWNPTFCNALEDGHDFTLTHMPSMRCSPSLSERLSIHGLWPSWLKTFGTCCNATGSNKPLDPHEVTNEWDNSLRLRMLEDWYDPVLYNGRFNEDNGCQICYVQNHEWQKHGLCYTDSPEEYFQAGLDMYDIVEEQRKQIDSMHGTIITVKDIEILFPKKVNVVCDPQASTSTDKYQTFSELQICFGDELTIIDCPAATYESNWTTACKHSIMIPSFL